MPKAKSNIDFLKEVYDLVGDEYIFKEDYIGSKIKINVLHTICNTTYSVKPEKFLTGRRCPKCFGSILKTTEDFTKEVFSLVGDEYTVVGEYINSQTHILMIHNICGEPYNALPNNFVKKKNPTRCSFCNGNRKYKIEDIRIAFENRECLLLTTDYIDVFQKLKYICLKHPEHEQSIDYHDFNNRGSGCKYCGIIKQVLSNRIDFETVKAEFERNNYILLVEEKDYIDSTTKMKYICPFHPNKDTRTSYSVLSAGHGCSFCGHDTHRGENHHFWKGGITELNAYLRNSINWWKQESFGIYNYKCYFTKEWNKDLQIHHLIPFKDIRDQTLYDLGLEVKQNISEYSEIELQDIKERFDLYHKNNLGIPMRKSIHDLFHSLFGVLNNTPEQFEEFKIDYFSGKYDERIAI